MTLGRRFWTCPEGPSGIATSAKGRLFVVVPCAREPINELDVRLGTGEDISRLPLHLSLCYK